MDVVEGYIDRALELVNKTNQFSINGLRIMSDDWEIIRSGENQFCYSFGYRDKFGDMGIVATVIGLTDGKEAFITHMALSCRAFGRRLEYFVEIELVC